ncbi:hypothetical protein MYCTH_2306035 [Thermothelomyces thermophilus ATCC 42464]|uniref:RING-type E3 ubiquitin transferase n=1 Tax=Thermothelomyces thermophilus (strain ATCC 42464 / BCRC 31852 / DSM 1799) TaxID=573729 RepID=G2QGM6_THET4|nr:uncharacterized protein MYCTH_2306035 [Thermothelomyces thermophilus ATCC 42464]AEO58588.1 hypothetical protein MYCTH_2306035 [Thermothelomyces thermophilus ATCC 42464]
MTSNGVPVNQPPDPTLDAVMDGLPEPFPAPDPTRFPNTRRRISSSATKGFRTNPPDSQTSDPDTCRICRGEGSEDEPLFFPCKCSGSIKYVHQDCLMEWLSHSQKKHCELCKTSFRFTKLYDPNMPKSLPVHVFLRHTAKYLLRNLLVWMRAALVANVWLVWLPYLMRTIWSFLFWISDEGLGGKAVVSGVGSGEFDLIAGASHNSNVCPSSPLFAATTTVASIGGVIDNLPPESARLVKGLYGIKLTSSDPIYSAILRLFFGPVATRDKPAVGLNATGAAPTPSLYHKSLLSDVDFLRNLTRHPSINRAVIHVLEGQIITILVIVCFILIILVRDYVVQQQPEINMRAAFAAVENPVQPAAVEPANAEVQAEAEPDDEQFEDVLDETTYAFDDTNSETADEDLRATLRDRLPDEPAESSSRPMSPNLVPPTIPAQGNDMQGLDRTTIQEYLDIYREAGGNLEEVLRIARERNLEVKLDHWMRLTRSMMARQRDNDAVRTDQAEPSGSVALREEKSDTNPFGPLVDESETSEENNSKGKEILVEDAEDTWGQPMGLPLRPRAHTDGPLINNTVNPFANNNWSFTDLPPDPPSRDSVVPESGIQRPSEHAFPAWEAPESSSDATAPRDRGASTDDSSQALPVGPDSPNRADAQPVPQAPNARGPAGFIGRIADFMWRQVDAIDPDDLAPVDFLGDFAEDEPEEEVVENAPANEAGQDRQGADAAGGLDAEAIEDAEDLEGILELLGMRGPVAGLFQNAIFCAFLVSITIFVGVFIPYNIGRVTIWGLANPMRIARMLFSLSKFLQDCLLLFLGLASSTISESFYLLSRALWLSSVADYSLRAVNASWFMALGAANRIGAGFVTELPLISASEVRNFSAISHAALFVLKDRIVLALSSLWHFVEFFFGGDYTVKGAEAYAAAAKILVFVKRLLPTVFNPTSWVLNFDLPKNTDTINHELAYWAGMDRFWATLAGYIAISLMAALYLRRGAPLSTTQAAQEWEASIIDGLNQASGVMKVILIISIEMLVFPLYCGMLLDVALLPLFEHTTLKSRLLFTLNYPVTSIFVHWFIGTGYMFHFALFVSMCRKIMRKGVLYFIRDPDDPEFHPVRDVLERNVTTQLRKILFSAFVYGALVVVCLGGVVWGLSVSLPVLPIHYSSNEPVLEFPIDLLFYNFLMPFAVKFFKPSRRLHAMYTWWFRRCARALRITWFLFGERRVDEEGQLILPQDSPDRNLPFWRRWFLEVDSNGRVVARSWRGILQGGTEKSLATKKERIPRKESLIRSGQLIPDGRFVRTPASDQVKIPKGAAVFLDVDENNKRLDKLPETDIYSTKQYQLVYVPPHFRFRIFLFILLIWIFAAVTGVSITIIPLVFGRWMLKQLIPPHIRTNDIYAFSIGIHILGSASYALFRVRAIYSTKNYLAAALGALGHRDVFRRTWHAVSRAARVAFTYFFTLVVFPLLAASLLELYALVPLNEVMYGSVLRPGFPNSVAAGSVKPTVPTHTIRVVQTWTLGLLYLKLAMRITNTVFRGSRVSNAARAVIRRGWLDPDVSILTRVFVIPGLTIWLVAVATPLLLAKTVIANGFAHTLIRNFVTGPVHEPPDQALYDVFVVLIYRMSFPFVAFVILGGLSLWSMLGVFRSWQVRIRDEAYLIGERLHNFGGTNAFRDRAVWRHGRRRI